MFKAVVDLRLMPNLDLVRQRLDTLASISFVTRLLRVLMALRSPVSAVVLRFCPCPCLSPERHRPSMCGRLLGTLTMELASSACNPTEIPSPPACRTVTIFPSSTLTPTDKPFCV